MRVFVTGDRGFAGRWLVRELETAGHELVGAPGPDVTDAERVSSHLIDVRPDAIVHLAAVAYAPDASADVARAFAVAVGGTTNLLEGVRQLAKPPVVVVVGSSEVYGAPRAEDLPLTEGSRLAPRKPYAFSKAAQESVALAYAARHDWPLAVVRPFNHTGPGQREVFVVPALARRVLDVRAGLRSTIPVGNIDVRRDFSDVRDVVRAYRLLLEALAEGRMRVGGAVMNVASGRSVAIRWILDELCRAAGVEPRIEPDPTLVRTDDPPDIRGDASALASLTGWEPRIPFEQTLRDVWADAADGRAEDAARR